MKMEGSVFFKIVGWGVLGMIPGMLFENLLGAIVGFITVTTIAIFSWIISLLRELLLVLGGKKETEETEDEAPDEEAEPAEDAETTMPL